MQAQESPQCGSMRTEFYRHFYSNCDRETWVCNPRCDEAYFTSGFNSNSTKIGCLQHDRGRELLGGSRRLFTAWTVKLNRDNQLIVEGLIQCGRRARTKPIAERLSALRIMSKFKHTYYLVGNITDPQHKLPRFICHGFYAGFPEDWEAVVEIWKNCVTLGFDTVFSMPDHSLVEMKRRLSIDDGIDSQCFIEYGQKVIAVSSETRPTERNIDCESIKEYCGNSKQGRIITNQNVTKSIVEHELWDEQRFKNINDVRQLTGWTPFVASNEIGKYCLVFRGTLLSSMGHVVSKNHVTTTLQRRHSARIIETVNQEFYELVGDVNNTKYDIPKELISWCRYGCPKRINSFCEKWNSLRIDEVKLRKQSSPGWTQMSPNQRASRGIDHTMSFKLLKNGGVSASLMRPAQLSNEKYKRKRSSMELNGNCSASTSDTSDDNDKTYHERPKAISTYKSWPKLRRKSQTDTRDTLRGNGDTAEGGNLSMIVQAPPIAMHQNEQPSSPWKQVPSLSYAYHRCAPLTDSSLSDGM